jgi:hypothetical protein
MITRPFIMDDVGVELNIQIRGNDVFVKNTLTFGRNVRGVYPCSEVDFSPSQACGG